MKTLIIIVTIIGLSAVIGSIIVGGMVFDGVVVEKPYEKGLDWDKRRNEKAESGWNVGIEDKIFRTGDNDIYFSVLDKDGGPLTNAQIAVAISRPSTTAYDKSFETSVRRDGKYIASINFPLYGYWDLKISVTREKRNVVFEERIYVENMRHEHMHGNAEADCNIDKGPCVTIPEHRDLQVLFDIDPKPVKTMTDLIFSVVLKEQDIPVTDADVTMDLSMPGMFMGINRPVMKHIRDGIYEGKGIIPVCPHGGKIWKAEVTVRQDGKSAIVSYIFEVE
ncbi:MAG: hypothetical protein C4526_06455 [Nitrospiraceae bacterium]|nr:MAG: hypothetical protein C4526_06455 [Nitrospiraceae bacterium]